MVVVSGLAALVGFRVMKHNAKVADRGYSRIDKLEDGDVLRLMDDSESDEFDTESIVRKHQERSDPGAGAPVDSATCKSEL